MHISSSHPCRKTDRPCPAHPHDFVPAYSALGLTPPSRTEELPQDAESCAHVAHGPGTLGGARMDGVKVPDSRAEGRRWALGQAQHCLTGCQPPAVGHQCWHVLAIPLPGYSLDSSKETSLCLSLPSRSIALCPDIDTNLRSSESPVGPTPAGKCFLLLSQGLSVSGCHQPWQCECSSGKP